jgi:hypothetical protein
MTAMLSSLVSYGGDLNLAAHAAEYLVSHGQSGGFGRFVGLLNLCRGDRVVIRTPRGLEMGTVLCPASTGHIQLLAATSAGPIVRRAEATDDDVMRRLQLLGRQIFEESRVLVSRAALPLEIVDVEILLDGATAVIQFLGNASEDHEQLVRALQTRFNLTVLLESLALAAPEAAAPEAEEHQHGCGKPDCGKVGGGGCTTCSTGGGCSSCGSGKVDMKAYFAHLRGKMDERSRTPLL